MPVIVIDKARHGQPIAKRMRDTKFPVKYKCLSTQKTLYYDKKAYIVYMNINVLWWQYFIEFIKVIASSNFTLSLSMQC